MAMKTEKKSKEFKGERGIARVAMMDGGNVRITFQETSNAYNLTKKELPEYFPFRAGKEIKANLTWDGENNKVAYANPVSGDFKVKFHHINKDDEVPAPIVRSGKKGNFNAFDVFLTIVEGAWKGAQGVRYLNPDILQKDEEGNIKLSGWGKQLEDMQEFVDVTGLSSMDIPYSENVLPEMQKRAKELGKEFMASFIDGKVVALSEYFNLEDEPEETEKSASSPADELLKD